MKFSMFDSPQLMWVRGVRLVAGCVIRKYLQWFAQRGAARGGRGRGHQRQQGRSVTRHQRGQHQAAGRVSRVGQPRHQDTALLTGCGIQPSLLIG